ncbi:MAG TPA: hypothetical protein VF220_02990 [Nitrososphaeraceae archaeon]
MNKKYLDGIRYNWEQDNRRLKINGIIPESRCVCCGRIFLNGGYGIAYCRDCDIAMSCNPLGPSHDFDTWGNKIKIKDPMSGKDEKKTISIILTARREIRGPIEFEDEDKYFDKSKKVEDQPHFMDGHGKIIQTEPDPEDADSDLYKMGLEK